MAHNRGERVKPIWDSNGLNFLTSNAEFSVPDIEEPILIMDMGGIIRNRPDPFSLPLSPNKTYVDFGLIWGEDIIDLLMSDRGKIILPLRKLQGFDELDAALAYAEDIAIGIDWSQSIESQNRDFRIDVVTLLQKLHRRGIVDIIIYSLKGECPYIPAGIAVNLNMKVVYFTELKHLPKWAKGAFVFE